MSERRWWVVYALLLGGAPLLWSSGFALTLLAQIGIAIIACLAFQLIHGEGGMPSFGHAIYSGLGAYATIHALNGVAALAADGWPGAPLWVALAPLLGALAGLAGAALLGYPTTRHGGTTFAMITLGLGELVWALAQMLPGWFGGESGISANRVIGAPLFGLISWGPQRQVVGLIAVYALLATLALAAWRQTPLGKLLNAVRDNPRRVEYLGLSAHQVRWRAFMVSGFFMGLAGGLAALNFELVSTEVLGAPRSAALLLFVVLGGAGRLVGALIGALLMVLSTQWLPGLLQGWQMLLGLLFMGVLQTCPDGLAGVLPALRRWRAAQPAQQVGRRLLSRLLAALLLTAGLIGLIELAYQHQQASQLGAELHLAGLTLASDRPGPWLVCVMLVLCGWALWRGLPGHHRVGDGSARIPAGTVVATTAAANPQEPS